MEDIVIHIDQGNVERVLAHIGAEEKKIIKEMKKDLILSIKDLYERLKDQSGDYGALKDKIHKVSREEIWEDATWGNLVKKELKKLYDEDICDLPIDRKAAEGSR